MGRSPLSRRTLLRGAGAAVALPLLEGMLPRAARAASSGGGPGGARRLVVFYVPCGMHMEAWTPKEAGAGYALTPLLQPLAPVKEHVLVVSGLANRPAYPDVPAPHTGGTGSFLTARKVGADGALRNGVSMDQVAARQLGALTPFPSLELGLDGSAAGVCEGGYSCAYLSNISWASETLQTSKEVNPHALFARLFGGGELTTAEAERRRRLRTSVLDAVRSDAERLSVQLGVDDRRRMDEYLTAVRELERRLQAQGASATCEPGAPPGALPPGPSGMPAHAAAMMDLMALALRCDQTRVITFMLGNGASARQFPFLGVSGQHHALSHHQGDPAKVASLVRIGTWEVEQLSSFLQRLLAVRAPDGTTLLDDTVVLFSSEMGDGNTHERRDLPVLLAGRAGGRLHPGRHLRLPAETPLANLHLTLLSLLDVPLERFGEDGTQRLVGL
jgi:hypothetical protein